MPPVALIIVRRQKVRSQVPSPKENIRSITNQLGGSSTGICPAKNDGVAAIVVAADVGHEVIPSAFG